MSGEETLTIFDRKTKESRTVPERMGEIRDYWWQEGNGSCDCNRHLYFWNWEFPDTEDDNLGGDLCAGHHRYIITHVDGDEVDFDEWNQDYKNNSEESKP